MLGGNHGKTLLLAEIAGRILPAEAHNVITEDSRRGYIHDYLFENAAHCDEK